MSTSIPKFGINDQQFSSAIYQLGEFVKIPSVSHPESPDYSKENLQKAAKFAGSKLEELKFEVSYPVIEGCAPFVIAQRIVDASKPTLLLYAHYDVQPVDRKMWDSNPFEMIEKDKRLYGRGSSDDKAGIIAIIAAIRACLDANVDLPNIKVLFEGEEEYGSTHMNALLKQEAERLKAEALIVLDGLNRDEKTGTLTSSTRGLVNLNLQVKALEKPVHSGIGCLAPDPAMHIASLVHSLRNPKEIPGFMDGAEILSKQEKEILKESSLSEKTYAKDMGMIPSARLRGNSEQSVYERILSEPSISIVNMNCGQPNGGNSIQDTASCTIGIRILPGQDPEHVANAVMKHIQVQENKAELDVKLKFAESAWAWKAKLDAPFSKMYFKSLKENYPEACVMPCGGALPLLKEFQEIFTKTEIIIPAVEDPGTNAHSHNESQHIETFRNSINSLMNFMQNVGKLKVSELKN